MTPSEMISEWRKGCSCAPQGQPEQCPACTRALVDALSSLDGYMERPHFAPVRIKYSEWLNPSPMHEGERILWSDGTVRGMPERDSEYVTVLRLVDPRITDPIEMYDYPSGALIHAQRNDNGASQPHSAKCQENAGQDKPNVAPHKEPPAPPSDRKIEHATLKAAAASVWQHIKCILGAHAWVNANGAPGDTDVGAERNCACGAHLAAIVWPKHEHEIGTFGVDPAAAARSIVDHMQRAQRQSRSM